MNTFEQSSPIGNSAITEVARMINSSDNTKDSIKIVASAERKIKERIKNPTKKNKEKGETPIVTAKDIIHEMYRDMKDEGMEI